jgi:hypothetical protein
LPAWRRLSGTETVFDAAEKRVCAKGRAGVRLTDVDPTHKYELLFDLSKKPERASEAPRSSLRPHERAA